MRWRRRSPSGWARATRSRRTAARWRSTSFGRSTSSPSSTRAGPSSPHRSSLPLDHFRPEETSLYPEDLKYTAEHEWLRSPGEHEGAVRVGITDYAQDALGDIVYVSLPEVGDSLTAGSTCGELESTKSVSDI